MFVFGNGRAIHVSGCSLLQAARRRETTTHELTLCDRTTVRDLLQHPQGYEFLVQRHKVSCCGGLAGIRTTDAGTMLKLRAGGPLQVRGRQDSI